MGEKNFRPEFRSCWTPVRKLRKKWQKNEKTSYGDYSQAKLDEIGREREKKILGPNSVYTGPRQKNSEKNCKKFQKF